MEIVEGWRVGKWRPVVDSSAGIDEFVAPGSSDRQEMPGQVRGPGGHTKVWYARCRRTRVARFQVANSHLTTEAFIDRLPRLADQLAAVGGSDSAVDFL